MNEEFKPVFTCPVCEKHNLEYEHDYVVVIQKKESVFCNCYRKEKVAATRQGSCRVKVSESGHITPTLTLTMDKRSNGKATKIVWSKPKVFCSCFGKEENPDWTLTQEVPTQDVASQYWCVGCADCKEQIPFAWECTPSDGPRQIRLLI